MIGYLRGRLLSKEPTQAIVEVAGVGYQVMIPLNVFYMLGEEGTETELHIHTHVRDDAIELFGFPTTGERSLFRRLIGISGVGPKLALAIIGGTGPADLLNAIDEGDYARIVQIPGIGKKTAERLVLELRDKLPEMRAELHAEASALSPASALKVDLVSALVNLGYRRRDAEKAADGAVQNAGEDTDFGDALKTALAILLG
ncbi:MAG TPA: Holliday junction branch migration protein RuvA [Acidobacteriota bacterium]|nr:Holliday junction branch migration protein RuvA [Acidobacteriota bacterium]